MKNKIIKKMYEDEKLNLFEKYYNEKNMKLMVDRF